MPRLEYFLVAESASVDRETNRVSIFNVLEEIPVPLPAVVPQLVALSCWRIAPEDKGKDFQVTLRIHMPGGDVPEQPGDLSVNFTPDAKLHRVQAFVAGLPIDKSGDWEFEILLNGEHQASHLVTVREPETAE